MFSLDVLGEQTKGQVQKSFQKDPRRATSGFGDGDVWLVTGERVRRGGVMLRKKDFDAAKEGKKSHS